MSNPAKDMIGQRFDYLVVIAREGSVRTSGTSAVATWRLRCDCGNEIVLRGQSLRNLHRRKGLKSCGCQFGEWNVKHGMTGTRPWNIWQAMRTRCTNPSDKDWKNYGGRGIRVCKRWENSFVAFWEDMGPTYKSHLTLDRKNVNGGYTPLNCRWVNHRKQSNNTRYNVHVNTPMGRLTIAQAARRYKIAPVTLYRRVRVGWDEKDLLKPVCTIYSTRGRAKDSR